MFKRDDDRMVALQRINIVRSVAPFNGFILHPVAYVVASYDGHAYRKPIFYPGTHMGYYPKYIYNVYQFQELGHKP
jgi:hypothetical protein